MNDQMFSYKFLTMVIDAIEFRIAAHEQELTEIHDDDRRSDTENDVAVLCAFRADLNKKLTTLVDEARKEHPGQ